MTLSRTSRRALPPWRLWGRDYEEGQMTSGQWTSLSSASVPSASPDGRPSCEIRPWRPPCHRGAGASPVFECVVSNRVRGSCHRQGPECVIRRPNHALGAPRMTQTTHSICNHALGASRMTQTTHSICNHALGASRMTQTTHSVRDRATDRLRRGRSRQPLRREDDAIPWVVMLSVVE